MKFLSPNVALLPKTSAALPDGFFPLRRQPIVIVMGLTGVGKSTVVEGLQQKINFLLLPNRRQLADAVIIAGLQAADGQTPHPVTDRLKRFEYTARYRAKHPGGMAHALSRLAVVPPENAGLILFDGLRGLDETQAAVGYFPQARFLVLDAPDTVRLTRLLIRGDAFDSVRLQNRAASTTTTAALRSVENIDTVFSQSQLEHVARAADAAGAGADDVAKKAAIIVAERRNYDSGAARQYLTQALPARQLLVIDTAQHSPAEVTALAQAWLAEEQRLEIGD